MDDGGVTGFVTCSNTRIIYEYVVKPVYYFQYSVV